MMPAKMVRFTIYITYPPNADTVDYEDMLNALIDTASDTTGLGVDGQFVEFDEGWRDERCFTD